LETLSTLPEWISLEHEVAILLQQQEEHGWFFAEGAARELSSTLSQELEAIKEVLQKRYPFVKGSEQTPKRNNKTQGYITGATFTRLKEFNPTSRDHIAWILQTHYGWTPTSLTASGKVMIDEVVLKELDIPFAQQCLRMLDLTKTLGMVSQGANAWLKLCTTSKRIHHNCSTTTATFRCSHRNPNLAQVPSEGRCRELFTATPGQVMVAADLSGIELRMLSHYLSRYDGGRYADILLNGDIHQVNADKIGVSRSQVKTITYAFLYGAGDIKLGHSYDKQLPENKAKKKGKELKEAYIAAIPGLSELLKAVKERAADGYLKAIDGRKVFLTSPHCALNYLLQSSSAILAKRWMVINNANIKQLGLYCSQLAFIHDEIQFECAPEHAEDLGSSLVLSAQEAGEYYRIRCPIGAEAKQGINWSETH
jgi:DNA polymerase I-like protein with 3'-5' exonuclease and polymerase domains